MRLWDLAEGRMLACLPEHEYMVRKVLLNSGTLYSASQNTLRLWDVRSHACTATLKMKGDIADMVLDDDGVTLFAAAEKRLRVWDMRMQSEQRSISCRARLGVLASVSGGLVAASMMNKLAVHDATAEGTDVRTLSPPASRIRLAM